MADSPTREELIGLCEDGIVPDRSWSNRDSAAAQRQLGEAWALLRAGCSFVAGHTIGDTNDSRTWWVEIEVKGFDAFEYGGEGHNDHPTFYIPTRERLDAAKVITIGDWY